MGFQGQKNPDIICGLFVNKALSSGKLYIQGSFYPDQAQAMIDNIQECIGTDPQKSPKFRFVLKEGYSIVADNTVDLNKPAGTMYKVHPKEVAAPAAAPAVAPGIDPVKYQEFLAFQAMQAVQADPPDECPF